AARHKNGTDLTRPLPKETRAILDGLPKIEGGQLVFSNDGKSPISTSKPMAKLRKACGFADWSTHDLRRTSRTLMSRPGVPSERAERCLGHVVGGVEGVYDKHGYYLEMKRAYEKLAAEIDSILRSPSAKIVQLKGKPTKRKLADAMTA